MATAALPTAPVGTPPPRGAQLPRVPSTELAIALERAAGLRLAAAERLVRSLPDMLGDALLGVELHFSAGGTFAAVARLAGDATALRQRLAFWCARAGARCLVPGDMPEEQRAAFRASLAQSEHSATAEPGAVAAEARRLFAEAGASPDRPEEATQPLLQLEVGGPEWKGVRWEPARSQLFVPGTLAPVEGDELTLCLRLTNEAGLRTRARVAEIRGPEQAGPGFPPGFTLSLLDPSSELLLSLDHHAEGAEAAYEKRRAHPRFAVRAPALVRAQAQAGADASPADEMLGPDGTPRFLLENISLGGAFVHCVERFPKDTPVQVTCTLPTGDTIRLEARVVFSGGHGMGLQWRLDPLAEQELAEVVARVASRPRRALLVDDDALFRRILSDALQERGFDVIEAADGVAALEVLSEELLSLDLLLADLRMPRMDGQALLRTVRSAGGESELAIVVVSAWIEGGLELKLQREGADAVLQKELGAAFIAQAANAVLERKRAARQA